MSMSPLAEMAMTAEKNRHPLKGVAAKRSTEDTKWQQAMPWNQGGKMQVFLCQSVLDQLSDERRAQYARKHGK